MTPCNNPEWINSFEWAASKRKQVTTKIWTENWPLDKVQGRQISSKHLFLLLLFRCCPTDNQTKEQDLGALRSKYYQESVRLN